MDEDDVVVEIDTFVCALDTFNSSLASMALSSVLQTQNRAEAIKIVIAQTVYQLKDLTIDDINMQGLTNIALRIVAFGVEMVDCILMGPDGYFSFRESEAWNDYQRGMKSFKELFLEEPFFPSLIKY